MTVVGGADFFRLFNGVWILGNADGTSGTPTWQQLSPVGTPPSPRVHTHAVCDPASNRMIVFGGFATTNCPCTLPKGHQSKGFKEEGHALSKTSA